MSDLALHKAWEAGRRAALLEVADEFELLGLRWADELPRLSAAAVVGRVVRIGEAFREGLGAPREPREGLAEALSSKTRPRRN